MRVSTIPSNAGLNTRTRARGVGCGNYIYNTGSGGTTGATPPAMNQRAGPQRTAR